ncbi:MAG TPA: hypothetical protein DDY14_07595 [Chromatiaceae bacterium]|jgi:hypothetical protein|nr:MAG: DUF721 domain-containing protein [Thiohalocapsa sp. PB-PSB1]HBG95177.1 hypothetical protein [Chromatiaceae bacterium]HCS91324.1 hypothetical protein [Chromatiaceae bacterium]
MTTENSLSRNVRHIQTFLRHSDAISKLLAEIQERANLLQQVRLLIPADIRPHCRQASLRDHLLIVCVDSPAWVAQMRLYAPTLINTFNTRYHESRTRKLNECRIQVLPEPPMFVNTTDRSPIKNSSVAISSLLQASRCVMNQELADSLAKLANTLSPTACVRSTSENV